MLRKSVTQQYPEVKPALPPRSRGVIALVEENCTSCMLCARECPDWCIYIDSHKETIPAPEGGRPRQRNVLDRFAIDFALCMYCGICIEVCPFDALFWSPEFEYAEGDIRNLLHEKDKLAAWTQTVPPPPAHDPGAEPPKELTAAPRRPAARTAAARPGATPEAPGTTGARRPARERGPAGAGEGARPSEGTASGEPGGAVGDVTKGAQPETGAESAALSPEPADTTPSPGGGDAGSPTGRADAGPSAEGADAGPAAGERAPHGPEQGERAREEAGPAEAAPGEGPAAPPSVAGRRERTRRPMSNVRGIRPPGALPPSPQPAEPPSPAQGQEPGDTASPETAQTPEGTKPPEATGPSEAATPSEGTKRSEAAKGAVPPEPEGDASHVEEDAPAPQAGEETNHTSAQDQTGQASEERPPGTTSSTGEPPSNRFSTGTGEPSPEPGPAEQTSSASPRRRRMADPRSIRPPGRLGPDDPEESEEES
ncbi:4Fe-4S binding protein [Nonomuraea spiralis]|uniref:4Fe-4S binding protein n=2 Tax=Nonomuraea spiralis TaxID=46182 RepID=A0ABV5ISP5_9ACTN